VSYRQQHESSLKSFLPELLGLRQTVTIPVIYVDLTRDLPSALILSRIVYLSDKSNSSDGWFYKSYSAWGEETRLSEHQVRRVMAYLGSLNLIETCLRQANGAPVCHYRVRWDTLIHRLEELNTRSGSTPRNTRPLPTETTNA
jgi:hypothetical protein